MSIRIICKLEVAREETALLTNSLLESLGCPSASASGKREFPLRCANAGVMLRSFALPVHGERKPCHVCDRQQSSELKAQRREPRGVAPFMAAVELDPLLALLADAHRGAVDPLVRRSCP